MKHLKTFLTLLILTIAVPLNASATTAEIGQNIPHPLSLENQNAERVGFEDITGEKGIVLVFVRSADWCPYCQIQLLELKDNGQTITDLGYNIVTISYDGTEVLSHFADKYDFPYTMLSDQGSVAIRAFGILNTDYDNDHFAYGAPYPNIYIIGTDQRIQQVLKEEGYKNRPQTQAIVAAIKGQ